MRARFTGAPVDRGSAGRLSGGRTRPGAARSRAEIGRVPAMAQREGADGSDAKTLFLEALELEDAARARFLAQLRGRQPGAAERVEALLAAHFGRSAAALEGLG